MIDAKEQHLPYRSTADMVVLDGDSSRWVEERTCRVRECSYDWRRNLILLSCGHGGAWLSNSTICYCPICGAKVVEDAR
jgi:hypothetical protein